MRIIDQFGNDYPYESIAISRGDGMIFARPVSNMDKKYLLAKHSSDERAEMVMNELHKNFSGIYQDTLFAKSDYFQFPQEDKV